MARTLHARQGDTLDALLARDLALGSEAIGIVLAANRGIAALGPVLPLGTPVVVPDDAIAAPVKVAVVNLWD